jgi:hypothetical protein
MHHANTKNVYDQASCVFIVMYRPDFSRVQNAIFFSIQNPLSYASLRNQKVLKKGTHPGQILSEKFFTSPVLIPERDRLAHLDKINRGVKSYHPSGMYLLTIRGIFFSLSSLMAICSGSVSPSRSTKTGAFMLICSALVPKILALSYFVMYGVVVLWSFAIFLSFGALSFPLAAAADGSPEITTPCSPVARSWSGFCAAWRSSIWATSSSPLYGSGSSGSYSGSSSSYAGEFLCHCVSNEESIAIALQVAGRTRPHYSPCALTLLRRNHLQHQTC